MTQRLTVATIAGHAANAITAKFEQWRMEPDAKAIDRLCQAIHDHALSPSIIYYSRWIDRWLMGDLVPGPGTVEGNQFQATYFSPIDARNLAKRCGKQFAEQDWFASRLQEAALAYGDVAKPHVIVVIRQLIGATATDDEIQSAAMEIPAWLLALDDHS